MGNFKLISVFFVVFFSPIILGQGSPNIIWEVQAFDDEIKFLSVSADGNTILSSNYSDSSVFYDDLGNFIDSYTASEPLFNEGGSISPTTEYFTVGYLQGIQMRGYSLVVRTEDHSILATVQGNYSVFSSDESRLVTAEISQMVYMYNIPNWDNPIIIDVTSNPLSLDVSENQIAVGTNASNVKLIDVITGNLIYTFTDFDNWVSSVKFSPDGSILATGQGELYSDGAIKVWNMNDYSLIADLDAFLHRTNSITFSTDGLYMIAAGQDDWNGPKIKIWRTTDWTLLKTYDSNLDNNVTCIVNLPNSYTFVYSTSQGHLVMADYKEVTEVEVGAVYPTTFDLKQNFPNPFNPTTTISFSIPISDYIKLAVYNTLGQEVAMLVNDMVTAGQHNVTFDASSLSSGTYLCRLQTSNHIMVKKMILLK